jgi:hypothetical protein
VKREAFDRHLVLVLLAIAVLLAWMGTDGSPLPRYLNQATTMTTAAVGSVPRWGQAVPGIGRSIQVGVVVKS